MQSKLRVESASVYRKSLKVGLGGTWLRPNVNPVTL